MARHLYKDDDFSEEAMNHRLRWKEEDQQQYLYETFNQLPAKMRNRYGKHLFIEGELEEQAKDRLRAKQLKRKKALAKAKRRQG